MEELLGCWRSLLLPLSSDLELSKQAQHLCRSLSAKGVKIDEDMLKVCLSSDPVHSSPQLQSVNLLKRVRSPSCLHRRCSLKMTSEDLLWEFLHSGTLSVTISFTRLCPSSQPERSLTVTLFSSWTRFVSSSLFRMHS